MKKFKSLLDELQENIPNRSKDEFIQSQANQVISSASNLISLIKDNYSDEEADDLLRGLILSIKDRDSLKFDRRIKKIKRRRKGNV